MTRPRGRPRKFDPDQALNAAMEVFWIKGLAQTSLDDLCAATGMNRPSIYNAFGDKEALYRLALERFCGALDQGLTDTLLAEPDLRRGLHGFFAAALDVYYSSDPPRGCMVMCTAPVEALVHEDVRKDLRQVLQRIDAVLEQRLNQARKEGQMPDGCDCRLAARLTQALLHSVALRARAGESKRAVQKLITYGIDRILTAA
ncbi:MAG: TetR/AcrR family transcriptional regulator [Pseudomonadales bacterium]